MARKESANYILWTFELLYNLYVISIFLLCQISSISKINNVIEV